MRDIPFIRRVRRIAARLRVGLLNALARLMRAFEFGVEFRQLRRVRVQGARLGVIFERLSPTRLMRCHVAERGEKDCAGGGGGWRGMQSKRPAVRRFGVLPILRVTFGVAQRLIRGGLRGFDFDALRVVGGARRERIGIERDGLIPARLSGGDIAARLQKLAAQRAVWQRLLKFQRVRQCLVCVFPSLLLTRVNAGLKQRMDLRARQRAAPFRFFRREFRGGLFVKF
ncbi:MAG: hypothetical protein HDKAJFGB_01469 [Anaerolineae bacterium]|nr:hypothetical protein [Anaerolineae bacterium]